MRVLAALWLSGCTGPGPDKDPVDDGEDLDPDEELVDEDEDGFFSDEDCDDSDPDIHPDKNERCDGVDNDCDGTVDVDARNAETWYADLDGDGLGDPGSPMTACETPAQHVADDSDCDDGDASIHPGADEVCDGVDNDCDNAVDTDAIDRLTFYADQDGDGYGDPYAPQQACESSPGYVSDDTDCDDTSAEITPERLWYADNDYDGFGDAANPMTSCEQPWGYSQDSTDCDDTRYEVRPGALELCDGLDNDCDSGVDGAVGACEALAGTYTGTYRLLTEEKVGTIVVNSMNCAEPSTLTITIDPSADPVVTGTATCTYSGGLGGFDDNQYATFDVAVTPDGVVSGYVEQEFSSFSFPSDWFDIEGTVGGGALSLTGDGLYWPSTYSAVGWETTITVTGTRE